MRSRDQRHNRHNRHSAKKGLEWGRDVNVDQNVARGLSVRLMLGLPLNYSTARKNTGMESGFSKENWRFPLAVLPPNLPGRRTPEPGWEPARVAAERTPADPLG